MKTQAVRLEDDQIALLEAVAEIEDRNTSDVIREGISTILAIKANEHARIAELREEAVRKRDEKHRQETAEALGGGL
jgi:Arc/MetJ-type ribon-helix-helix transcriptional regulator